ncbi:hypothetical protein K1719_005272 [Acacia pycnantha]|nr:hypothetical protein K1719_005272 [Acacia pycnantha]
MKKLYRRGTVHPSPPTISDQLAFLPATILTLTAALSPEDREVLAYLISCSSSNTGPPFTDFSGGNPRRSTQKNSLAKGASASTADGSGDHPPLFTCSCFRCYMSYWIRWDSSPNRQLIHEIIDAFEDWLAQNSKNGKNNRKDKRNKRDSNKQSAEMKQSELTSPGNNGPDVSESVGESSSSGGEGSGEASASGSDGGGTEEEDKGSVRRFVSFIGEKIWGGWGQ